MISVSNPDLSAVPPIPSPAVPDIRSSGSSIPNLVWLSLPPPVRAPSARPGVETKFCFSAANVDSLAFMPLGMCLNSATHSLTPFSSSPTHPLEDAERRGDPSVGSDHFLGQAC